MLGVAALAGDCGIDMLARALDADPSELLRPAIDADVIEVTDNRVRYPPPLASVSHAGTNDTSRRDAHRRLAAAVADPEQRARHLALAADGPDPSIAEDLDQAARDASRRALRLPPQSSPDSLRSSRRLTVWTNAPIASSPPRSTTGSPASTATRALLEPLVDMLPASPRRARALFCLGWTEAIGRGRELCAQALNEAEGAPALTAAIRHLLGYVELVAGRLNRAREQAAAAVQDAKDAGIS